MLLLILLNAIFVNLTVPDSKTSTEHTLCSALSKYNILYLSKHHPAIAGLYNNSPIGAQNTSNILAVTSYLVLTDLLYITLFFGYSFQLCLQHQKPLFLYLNFKFPHLLYIIMLILLGIPYRLYFILVK